MSDSLIEDGIKSEKDRVQDLIGEIDELLDNRFDVYEQVLNELDSEIMRQKDRLDRAGPQDESDVRSVLGKLYGERRSVREDVWRDAEGWIEQRLELKRELSELDDAERMDL